MSLRRIPQVRRKRNAPDASSIYLHCHVKVGRLSILPFYKHLFGRIHQEDKAVTPSVFIID